MAVSLSPPFIIPLTDKPSQTVNVTLGGQACKINVYTKSTNVPIEQQIPTSPPDYENINPVFLDLYIGDALVIGGVICRASSMMVMNTYLGFIGDLSMVDTSGAFEDPVGVSVRLPPPDLRNFWQRSLPLFLGGMAPPNIAGTIPGLGSRFQLTYWPNLV